MKEKKKNSKIEKLRKKAIFSIIMESLGILLMIFMICITNPGDNKNNIIVFGIFLWIVIWGLIMIILSGILTKERDSIKLTTLKNALRKGELNKVAILSSELIKNEIIVENVESLNLIKSAEKGKFILKLSLKGGFEIYSVHIPKEVFISAIKEDTKNELLDYATQKIILQKEEDGKVLFNFCSDANITVPISATDDELLEMFELKE